MGNKYYVPLAALFHYLALHNALERHKESFHSPLAMVALDCLEYTRRAKQKEANEMKCERCNLPMLLWRKQKRLVCVECGHEEAE